MEISELSEQTANTIDSLKTEFATTQTALATINEHMTDKQALLDELRKQLAQVLRDAAKQKLQTQKNNES